MKVRSHDGHYLSHTTGGRVTIEADYANDTSPVERRRRASLFCVEREKEVQGEVGVLCDERGRPVVYEEKGGKYGLRLEKYGPEEYGLKAINPESGQDAGQYLTVGIEELRLRPELNSLAVFKVVEG